MFKVHTYHILIRQRQNVSKLFQNACQYFINEY